MGTRRPSTKEIDDASESGSESEWEDEKTKQMSSAFNSNDNDDDDFDGDEFAAYSALDVENPSKVGQTKGVVINFDDDDDTKNANIDEGIEIEKEYAQNVKKLGRKYVRVFKEDVGEKEGELDEETLLAIQKSMGL